MKRFWNRGTRVRGLRLSRPRRVGRRGATRGESPVVERHDVYDANERGRRRQTVRGLCVKEEG